MLERIVLAAIITFCVYLFLNLGTKPVNIPSLDIKQESIPEFVKRIASFSW